MPIRRPSVAAVAFALFAPISAFATNGMNMDGYGPIATGMGGASFAYENGTAAMMNNPATLGLMPQGSRLDVALGNLRPDVESSYGSAKWSSKADSFLMPALGYARHTGQLTFGAGVFAQGGMGTDYRPGPGASMTAMGMMSGGAGGEATATAAGWQERSEVGVGRMLLPVVYDVSDKLSVGGSLDLVWATLDLRMAMPGLQMQQMMPGGSQQSGTISGSMVDALMGQMQAGNITGLWGGYFDFSDSNDFWGKTEATGFAGKLGLVYRITPQLSVGATYHSETDLGSLSGNGTVSMAVQTPAGTAIMPVQGRLKVRNFQWPETYGVGIAYNADRFLLAADVKQINWGHVMKSFDMDFTASSGQFAGTDMRAKLFQDWKDQTVVMLGAAFRATDALTLRAGANLADNPIPASTLNYLFPAIVKNHYTLGAGYAFGPTNEVNLSLTFAPEVKVETPSGLNVSHAQISWQAMYSQRF